MAEESGRRVAQDGGKETAREIYRKHGDLIDEVAEDGDEGISLLMKSIRRIAGSPMPDGYVYAALSEDGYVKIGRSKDPEERVKSLSTGNPNDIELIAKAEIVSPREKERELHQQYHDARERGEWFDLTDEQVTDLKRRLEAISS